VKTIQQDNADKFHPHPIETTYASPQQEQDYEEDMMMMMMMSSDMISIPDLKTHSWSFINVKQSCMTAGVATSEYCDCEFCDGHVHVGLQERLITFTATDNVLW